MRHSHSNQNKTLKYEKPRVTKGESGNGSRLALPMFYIVWGLVRVLMSVGRLKAITHDNVP